MSENEKPIVIKLCAREKGCTTTVFDYTPRYRFISDPNCIEYDWYAVYNKLPSKDNGVFRNGREQLVCPRERTIFLTSEPVSISTYGTAFTRQFGHMLTNRPQEAEEHPHYHFGQGYYQWHYGKAYPAVASEKMPPKKNILSAVCSSKQMKHTCHYARYLLIRHLAETIPGLDWFGRGVKPLEKKYNALDTYQYHIAIENHIAPGHWSEKIVDALLAECLPFYAGDPQLGTVLPPESFIPIPIDDRIEAERIIREAIRGDEYRKRLPAIREAKRLLLERYNLWAQIIRVIESEEHQTVTPVSPDHPIFLTAAFRLRRNPLIALSDGWKHLRLAISGCALKK